MNSDQGATLFAAVVVAGLYFLPTIFAAIRRHPSGGGILVLNLFLGWSGFGWLGALVWSLSSTKIANQTVIVNNQAPSFSAAQRRQQLEVDRTEQHYLAEPQPATISCPMCAENIKVGARKCRFCGEYFLSPLGAAAPEEAEWEEVKAISPPDSLVRKRLSLEIFPENLTSFLEKVEISQDGAINPWSIAIYGIVGLLMLLFFIAIFAG